jgi:hypothetical protein
LYYTRCSAQIQRKRGKNYATYTDLASADDCAAYCSSSTGAPASDESRGESNICVGFSWLGSSVYGGSTLCMLKSGSNVGFEDVRDYGVVALAGIKVRYYRESK